MEAIEEVTTMKLKKAWNRRLSQSNTFPSLPQSRIVPLSLFPQKIPWFSFPSFNRKLCEATVSFFSKLSQSQTVFVLGRRVSVSMVHGRTQRVRAPFRGRARKIERRKNKEREIERHYTHSVQLVRHFHQLLVHLNANIFTLQIQKNGSQISQTL